MPGWDVRFRTLRRLLLPGLAFELDRRWIKKNRRDYRLGSEVQCNRIYINRFGNDVIIVS